MSHSSRSTRHRPQRGQVMLLFALATVIVLGMASIAVDGGYGLVQSRRAQNAADFASVAGTATIRSVCQGGANPPSNQVVWNAIQDVIDQNSTAVGSSWNGAYLDSGGAVMKDGSGNPFPVTQSSSSYPPLKACGVQVTTSPSWTPFLAQILGYHSLTSSSIARSSLSPGAGQPVGIVALDQVAPHEVLGGGKGSFNVFGTIFANSTVPYNPWSQTHNGFNYVDVVDAKDNSQLLLHGNMETVGSNWPLDWCFGVNVPAGQTNPPYNKDPKKQIPPTNPPNPDPLNIAVCSGGTGSQTVDLRYDYIDINQTQVVDPLLPVGSYGVQDPFDTSSSGGYNQSLCPGELTPPARTVPAPVGGVTTLLPGDYAAPVVLTGSVDFADCSGSYDTNPGTSGAYPGVFRFEQGLLLMPTTGATVRGNNVMLATKTALAMPGNVPGSYNGSGSFVASGPGNGAPCFPAGVTTSTGTRQTDDPSFACAGTSPSDPKTNALPYKSIYAKGPFYGVRSYNENSFALDSSAYGTGSNYSLVVGGQGTVTLTAPTGGVFQDVALFQSRNTQGNFGFDAEPGDSAALTVNGVVYNASLPCKGYPVVGGVCTNNSNKPASNPFDYWDVGIPFHSGGVLQAGLGSGTGYPNPTGGSVTVNGPCVVDDFNTDGLSTIKIDGTQHPYNLPGIAGSGNPPVTG